MAKRKSAKRKSVSRKSTSSGSSNILGIKYDSLTFLLFLVFVLVVAMVFVSRTLGMGGY